MIKFYLNYWKKIILMMLTGCIVFISGFFYGTYNTKKDHFTTRTFKSVSSFGDQFVSLTGEMAALDFEPGLKLRSVEVNCIKYIEDFKICAWAEYSVMNSTDSGFVSLEFIENHSFKVWNKKQILAIINKEKYERTINIDIPNEIMTDIYKYKNGEVRSTRLVGTFDKLGSFKSLRE